MRKNKKKIKAQNEMYSALANFKPTSRPATDDELRIARGKASPLPDYYRNTIPPTTTGAE